MTLRVGLIGTGYWAKVAHGAAVLANPSTKLVGVWGRDSAKAGVLARELSAGERVVHPYEDLDALLAEVDAVALAIAPTVQPALAVRAAEAGCHLLLDKPVGLTVEDATRVRDAVASAGVASVVFFTERFLAERRAWLRDTAETGGWWLASGHWRGSIFNPGSPFGESQWRKDYGALWDVGPHALSVLLPILGDVRAVAGMSGRGDTSQLMLRHDSGATSTVSLSLTLPQAAAGRPLLQLFGEAGVRELPEISHDVVDTLSIAIDDLVEAAATGETRHECDVRFGLRVVEILTAARTALDENRVVDID
jgi:predicted dehydrogenase